MSTHTKDIFATDKLRLGQEDRKLIEDSYPDKILRRRSCGYVIDEVIVNLTDESKLLREFGIRKFKKE